MGAFRTGLLIGNRPVDNRPQDASLPHYTPTSLREIRVPQKTLLVC